MRGPFTLSVSWVLNDVHAQKLTEQAAQVGVRNLQVVADPWNRSPQSGALPRVNECLVLVVSDEVQHALFDEAFEAAQIDVALKRRFSVVPS